MTAPVSIERFVEELEKLKGLMESGELQHGEYDRRLARVIQELRERGIDGDRTKIIAALEGAYAKGTITTSVKTHLENRLGLV